MHLTTVREGKDESEGQGRTRKDKEGQGRTEEKREPIWKDDLVMSG
jgi:hypothetical protein